MAIEILKQGRVMDCVEVVKAVCKRCECEFTFQGEDYRHIFGLNGDDYMTVACPCCNALLFFQFYELEFTQREKKV